MRHSFLTIFIIGFLLYLPSLFGPFLWDDEDFVYANKYVKEFRIDKFFTESQTAGRGKMSNYYRPIPQIAYATTHTVFGFNPFWFHLLNVLAHIGAASTIFYFLKKLLKSDTEIIPSMPLLISLFFLIHPIQTEAVSYISGLSDPLYVLFGFLSLIFFMLKDLRKNMIPLSLFFFTLSILSKETGLVFLPLIICLSFLLNLDKSDFSSVNLFKNNSWRFLYKTWKVLCAYISISIIYLWYHYTWINNIDIKSVWGNNPYANSALIRLLTFIQNIFLYIQILIFPKDLFMERDYSISVQTQLLNPYLLLFVLINLLIIFSFWKLRNSVEFKKLKIVFFFYLAFFISLIPYTGIVLINGIFYEHFLYLPLVFFFAFLMFYISFMFSESHQNKFKKILPFCIIAILILFAARNISRQFEWNDSIRFYKQTLIHAPKSVRIINGLGMAYAENGENQLAIQQYKNMIKINPNVPNAYHNMANAYGALGNLKEAEKFFLKALEVDPNFIFSAQSLVNLYQQTGQKEKLESLLKKYNN